LRLLREAGRPRVPTASEKRKLDAEPPLEEIDRIALACWRDLDSERPQGFAAPGAIPWSAIMAWAREMGIWRTQARVLAEIIRILDVDRAEAISSEMEMKR